MVDRVGDAATTLELGYWLSSEEHAPLDLVRCAQRAEEVGFTSAVISDHFHPWTSRQGQAPFAWTVLGAIAASTTRIRVGTGVTAPIIRMHPAVVAQAAATAACLMPGRFFLGLGSGERLNEHVTGQHWPPPATRAEMLEEAVTVIRRLFDGGMVDFRGEHLTVERAQLFTRPEVAPPVYLAAGGRGGARRAGRIADGLIAAAPDRQLVDAFEAAGGAGRPRVGQVKVCWAASDAEARRIAREWWPIAGLPSSLLTELAEPRHFEAAGALVTESQVADVIACGPDPEVHMAAIGRYAAAGFSEVLVHQVGPDQCGFFEFYEREIIPRMADFS